MLIVCPSCASEYMIDPERLGAEGRTVRCATCRETWFVAPEPEDASEAPDADAWAVAVPESAGSEETESGLPPAAVEDENAPADSRAPPKRDAQDARAASRRAPSRAPLRPGLLLVVATLVIAVAAILGRAHVVRTIPTTAALYARIGLAVNLRGLEFRGVRSEVVESGGGSFLLVEGEIANISGRDAAVPPIEVRVRGAEGQMLYTWTNDPPRGTLGMKETTPFRARLASPPPEARQVLVQFGAGRDGADVASRAP